MRVADISVETLTKCKSLVEAADVAKEHYHLKNHPYFRWIRDPERTLDEFRLSQLHFFYPIEHFSRCLAAILARIPDVEKRISTVFENVVEEHGQGSIEKTHKHTFLGFLRALGVAEEDIPKEAPIRLAAVSEAILNFCLVNHPEPSAAMMGMIEFMYIDVSNMIVSVIKNRYWGDMDAQYHYRFHEELDVEHARDLFLVGADQWDQPFLRDQMARAVLMGAQYVWHAYQDMLPHEDEQLRASMPPRVRRNFARRPCSLAATVQVGKTNLPATVEDISAYGAGVRGKIDLKPDDIVDVSIHLGSPTSNENLQVKALVRYVATNNEDGNLYGLQFKECNLDPDSIEKLLSRKNKHM